MIELLVCFPFVDHLSQLILITPPPYYNSRYATLVIMHPAPRFANGIPAAVSLNDLAQLNKAKPLRFRSCYDIMKSAKISNQKYKAL